MFKLNLQRQTDSIVKVFTSTVEKLQQVNRKAEEEMEINQIQIEDFQERIKVKENEIDTLNTLKSKNSKLIDNINKLFE
jgi:hypothetical protein